MLERPNVHTNTSYLVPCVFKAVQMIEALRKTRDGLRVEDFLSMTGYSRSTIYRILRTLVACEYIVREHGGAYSLNRAVISVADENAWTRSMLPSSAPANPGYDGQPEFERWGVRFRADGKKAVSLARNGNGIAHANPQEA
jgi:hypothetical protein